MTSARPAFEQLVKSPSPAALSPLQDLVGPSRILFVSDFPFAEGFVTSMQVQELENLSLIDDSTRTMIDRDNALRLFPRHALAAEEVEPAPVHSSRTFRARARRAMSRTRGALVNRMRNQ
jgi:hypothetical protein